MTKFLLGLVALAACHKVTDVRTPQTADALWALAPEGAKLGIVITPRAVGMLAHALQDLHAFVQKAPELTDAANKLDDRLRSLTGTADIQLTDYGLTADKGAAVFVIDRQNTAVVVPVGDRERYLAKAHGTKGADVDTVDYGTCKTIKGYYVCVSTPAMFPKLGKGKLRDLLDSRGDVEVVAHDFPEMESVKTFSVAFELERGGVIAHGTMAGPAIDFASELGNALKPDVDRTHASGFAVIDLSKTRKYGTDEVIAAGVTDAAIAKSIAGPVYLSVPAGQLAFDLRAPLLDPAPMQTVLDHCAEGAPPELMATSKDGTCHAVVPEVNLGVDAWIADKMLRIGMKQANRGVAVTPTRGEVALADSAWNFAMWGRGSLLTIPTLPLPPALLASRDVRTAFRALLLVNEIGFAIRTDGDKLRFAGVVRTAFENPDDVVAKLATVSLDDVIAGKGAAALSTNGSAPIADDMKAGFAGLAVPVVLIGLAATVPLGD